MLDDTLLNTEDKMQKVVLGAKQELATIRTGRASPTLVEHMKIDYAGSPMPLNQIAGISVPDARLLVIQPWDPNSIRDIEKAIQASDLGLNPSSDGKIIRIAIPPLSEERRKELVKAVHNRIEERRITVRNLRRDAMEELKGLEKDKEISMDERERAGHQVQQLTDKSIADIEKVGQDKETELGHV